MIPLLRYLTTGQWSPPTHEPIRHNGRLLCIDHKGGAVEWPCAEAIDDGALDRLWAMLHEERKP